MAHNGTRVDDIGRRASLLARRTILPTRQLGEVPKARSLTGGLARRLDKQNAFGILLIDSDGRTRRRARQLLVDIMQ